MKLVPSKSKNPNSQYNNRVDVIAKRLYREIKRCFKKHFTSHFNRKKKGHNLFLIVRDHVVSSIDVSSRSYQDYCDTIGACTSLNRYFKDMREVALSELEA